MVEQLAGIEHHDVTGIEGTAGKAVKLASKTQGDHSVGGECAPGSLEAQKAFAKLNADAHSPAAIAKAKAAGFEKATGFYKGKPLISGSGAGQGDHQLLVDKLVMSKGFSVESASKIAGKVASDLKAGK